MVSVTLEMNFLKTFLHDNQESWFRRYTNTYRKVLHSFIRGKKNHQLQKVQGNNSFICFSPLILQLEILFFVGKLCVLK